MQKIIERCEELKYRLCQNIRRPYKKAIYELREWFKQLDRRLFGNYRRQQRYEKAMNSFPRPPFSHKVFDSWKVPPRKN